MKASRGAMEGIVESRRRICIPVWLWYDLTACEVGRADEVKNLELELPDGDLFSLPRNAGDIAAHIWVSGGWAYEHVER